MSRQLLRTGTSIGVNVNEAQAAQSRAGFVSKMAIASKEARETRYWLDLLVATDHLDEHDEQTRSLIDQSAELTRFLTAIVKTTQSKK